MIMIFETQLTRWVSEITTRYIGFSVDFICILLFAPRRTLCLPIFPYGHTSMKDHDSWFQQPIATLSTCPTTETTETTCIIMCVNSSTTDSSGVNIQQLLWEPFFICFLFFHLRYQFAFFVQIIENNKNIGGVYYYFFE